MNNQTRMELALQGVRHASNMLVEVIGNHARPRNGFSPETMKLLSEAAHTLSSAQEAMHKDLQGVIPDKDLVDACKRLVTVARARANGDKSAIEVRTDTPEYLRVSKLVDEFVQKVLEP